MGSPNNNRHEPRGRGLARSDLPIETQAAFVRPVRLGETVRQVLLENIRRRRWASELPSERHLSRELRVSRPTLRLVLHSLADEGFLKLQPRRPSLITDSAVSERQRPKRVRDVVLLYNGRSKPDLTSLAAMVLKLQQRCHPFG